ncbi:MAG: hypothetical protein HZC28_04615 [Spirochaetes bacterium]|nr:hypothetical protein [Spirochaetota bacterium]
MSTNDRKGFLRSLARIGIAGGITALGGVAVVKSAAAKKNGCVQKNACEICSDVFTCTDGRAQKTAAMLAKTRTGKAR